MFFICKLMFLTSVVQTIDKTRQNCPVLSCRRYEQNWRQVKTVFSSPQCIGDWTVLSSPVCCVNAFANKSWLNITKSRQDKTLFTPHFETGQNSFEIFCSFADSLDLSPVLFTPPTQTDKTVLSCPCRRCVLGFM